MIPETEREVKHSASEDSIQGGLNLVSLNQPAEQSANKCSEDTEIKQLSRVGNLVQSEINKEVSCQEAAHPSDEHSFNTVNKDSLEQLKLQDIFSREDIYKAMMNDKMVQKALADNKDNLYYQHPKDFDELEEDLSGKDGFGLFVYDSGKTDSEGNDVSFALNDHIFSNFAFHDLKGNMVGTRLLLDYSSEASRNAMYQLGIYLPVPPAMANDFRAAASHQNGSFLMKDSGAYGKVYSRQNSWIEPND